MYKYLLTACICIAISKAFAQNTVKDSLGNALSASGGFPLSRFSNCTIKMKDGTRLIDCTIKEIKPLYVVFQKNRVLHDAMIEKIKCIVPEGDKFVLWFDEKNKAVAGMVCP